MYLQDITHTISLSNSRQYVEKIFAFVDSSFLLREQMVIWECFSFSTIQFHFIVIFTFVSYK